MATFTSLGDLVGDPDVFLAEHFGRQPLLRRGALAGLLDHLGSSDELLHDVMALETLPVPYVRLIKNGKAVPRAKYLRHIVQPGIPMSEMLSPPKIAEQYRSGSTVVCNYLNHFWPSMRQLSAVVGDAFASTGEVAAFLTPPGNAGLAPHCDPVDVFVVHLEGTKHWTLWQRQPDARPGRPLAELGEPVLDTILRPGDMLYIPINTPHAAAALDTAAMHVSVSVEPRRWRDVLRATVDALLADDRYDGNVQLRDVSAHGPAALAAHLAALRDQLAALDPAIEVKRILAADRGTEHPA